MSRPRIEDLEASGATTTGQIMVWNQSALMWEVGAGLPLIDPSTTKGDLLARSSSAIGRLAVGSNGQVLTADSTQTLGVKWDTLTALTDPTTTKGDLITRTSSAITRRAVGSNGQVLTADSAETDGVKWATPSGGGATINDRRWVRGSTAHAQDDEFNDASLAAAWVNVAGTGGTYTWTEAGDSLSLYQVGSGNQNLWAKVKPYALAVGEAVQIHATALSPVLSAYPLAGPVISDGATTGAGNQAFFEMINGTGFLGYETAAWTNWQTRGAVTDYTQVYPQIIEAHMRLTRTSTNVYTPAVSRDGISWVDLATISVTMTPSHVGIAASTFGGAGTTVWSFDYFRIT